MAKISDWRRVERDTHDTLGEGTLWSARDGALYWVDILAPALNRLSLGDGAIRRWAMPEPLGWVVERAGGGFIAGFRSGFAELDLDPAAPGGVRVRPFLDPEPDLPGNRMNDGKADATGAIWCGTMDMAEAGPSGALYRLSPDRRVERMASGFTVPNGPAFAPCGRWLYHSDTALRTVYRHARHDDGTLGVGEPFIVFTQDEGYPDGMTVDTQGGLWIAHWNGGRISRFDADGRLAKAIPLPAAQVTNLAFCGPEHDRLFVTSAAVGLAPSEFDGALFEVKTRFRGSASGLFPG